MVRKMVVRFRPLLNMLAMRMIYWRLRERCFTRNILLNNKIRIKLVNYWDTGAFESKYVLDHLRHQLKGFVNINWLDNLTQMITARYEKRINTDSHGVFDSRLIYKWDQYELFLDITNIFDESYMGGGFSPAAGRWIICGVRFNKDM